MRKKSQWLLSTTLFISLGLAACESQQLRYQAIQQQQQFLNKQLIPVADLEKVVLVVDEEVDKADRNF